MSERQGFWAKSQDGYVCIDGRYTTYRFFRKTKLKDCQYSSVQTCTGIEVGNSPWNKSFSARKYTYTTTNENAIIGVGGSPDAWIQIAVAAINGDIKNSSGGAYTNDAIAFQTSPACFTSDGLSTKCKVEVWLRSLSDTSNVFGDDLFYIYEFIPITSDSGEGCGLQLRNSNNKLTFDSGYKILKVLPQVNIATFANKSFDKTVSVAYLLPSGTETTSSDVVAKSSQYRINIGVQTASASSPSYYWIVRCDMYQIGSDPNNWHVQAVLPLLAADVTGL